VFKCGDFFFPDGEHHFTKYGDEVIDYQRLDREAAYSYVKRWRRALDVGANVGLFAYDFAQRFEEVVAFEPIPETKECLEVNVPPNVRVEPYAIVDRSATLEMYRTGSSGGSFICNHCGVVTPDLQMKPGRIVKVEGRPVDSYHFDAVDLIKLDVQGAEYLAIVGARETILRHRPVILVEEKPAGNKGFDNVKRTAELLISFGMVPKERAQADRVYIFED
jgi:FkbM family methyltransferase